MSVDTTPTPLSAEAVWSRDRVVAADDGALIAYTLRGPAEGRVVALLPGFLAADVWWRALVPALIGSGHRVLLLDYRDDRVGGSAPVTRLAADLATVVDHEEVDDITLVGHSMGVQVLLAAYDALAARVRSIALLSGSAVSPLRTPFDVGVAASTYYAVLEQTTAWLPASLRRVLWQGGWDSVPFHHLGQSLGLFAADTDPAVAKAYAREAGRRDPDAALALAADMHAYDAEQILEQVAVPALVVTGSLDPFCPPATARRTASLLADAEVRIVPGGTHSAILDDADVVNGWILDHLCRA